MYRVDTAPDGGKQLSFVAWLPSNAKALNASQIAGFSKAAQRALGLISSLPRRARTHESNRARTRVRVRTTTAAKPDGSDDSEPPARRSREPKPLKTKFISFRGGDLIAIVYALCATIEAPSIIPSLTDLTEPLKSVERLILSPCTREVVITPWLRLPPCWAVLRPGVPAIAFDTARDFFLAARMLKQASYDIELLTTEDGRSIEQTLARVERLAREEQAARTAAIAEGCRSMPEVQ
jgi:hypothetical protein